MPRIAACTVLACLLAAAGCSKNQTRDDQLTRDNERLATELALIQEQNDELRQRVDSLTQDNRALRAQINGLQTQLARQTSTSTPRLAGSTTRPAPRETGPSTPTGGYVLVCSSVGKSHVDEQMPIYERMVERYNREYGQHGAFFGIRTPSSGGLQFVFGKHGSDFGLARELVEAARKDLVGQGRFKDSYILKLD